LAERIVSNTPNISGAAEVVAWFGRWPSFHDAEIISLQLHCSDPSALVVYAWNMTNKVDATRHYVLEKHALVTFTLRGVSDLDLADFSDQNVISSLDVEKRENGFRITLHPCYGLCGTVDAETVSVSVKPWKPNPANNTSEGICR
jgi:hypothetical protein